MLSTNSAARVLTGCWAPCLARGFLPEAKQIGAGHVLTGHRAPRLARGFFQEPTQIGTKRRAVNTSTSTASRPNAIIAAELPAVIDLFLTFAKRQSGATDRQPVLDFDGLRRLLAAIGEHVDDTMLHTIFHAADTDHSGAIDLDEFLVASQELLRNAPARSVLVVGGPGSGKGVLCARLVAVCGVAHVSTGDMLRQEVSRGTPLGNACAEMIRKGELVPSEIITTLLRRRMSEHHGRRLLLDGFPRSQQNAIDFERQCGKPELALSLTCSEEIMLERILYRSKIEGRADDNIEAARIRIATFKAQGTPTLDWLRRAGVPIIELNCSGTPDDVWAQLIAVGRLMRGAVALDALSEAAPRPAG
jgi:adenylate kinase